MQGVLYVLAATGAMCLGMAVLVAIAGTMIHPGWVLIAAGIGSFAWWAAP